MKHINRIYAERCEAVNKAIWQLCMMNIAIDSIDINRALPVITVQATGAVRQLKGAVFLRKGVAGGTVARLQTKIENCRIEWEI